MLLLALYWIHCIQGILLYTSITFSDKRQLFITWNDQKHDEYIFKH